MVKSNTILGFIIMSVRLIEYVNLDLESKLRYHVEENHESPLSGITDIIEDTDVFRNKKLEAFQIVLKLAEKEHNKQIEEYKTELKKAEAQQLNMEEQLNMQDEQLVDYEATEDENSLPDGFDLTHPGSFLKSTYEHFGNYLYHNLIFDAGFRVVTTETKHLKDDAYCYCPCSKMFHTFRCKTFKFPESLDGCIECKTKRYTPSGLIQHLNDTRGQNCFLHHLVHEYISTLYNNMWGETSGVHYAFLTKKADILQQMNLHSFRQHEDCVTNHCILLSCRLKKEIVDNSIASIKSNKSTIRSKTHKEVIENSQSQIIQINTDSIDNERNTEEGCSFGTTLFVPKSNSSSNELSDKTQKNVTHTLRPTQHKVHKEKQRRHDLLCQQHSERQHSSTSYSSNQDSLSLHSNRDRRFCMAKNDNTRVPDDRIPNTRNFCGRNHVGGGQNTMTYGQQCHFTHRQMRPPQQNLPSYQHNSKHSWKIGDKQKSYHKDNRPPRIQPIDNNAQPRTMSNIFKKKLKDSDCVLLTDKNTAFVYGECEMFFKELPGDMHKAIPLNSLNHFCDVNGRRWIMLDKEETSSNSQSLENVIIENVSPLASKSTSTSSSSKRKVEHQGTENCSKSSTKKHKIVTSKKTFDIERQKRKKFEKKLTNSLKDKFVKNAWIQDVVNSNNFKFCLLDTDTKQLCKNCSVVRCYPKSDDFELNNWKSASIDNIVKKASVKNTIWHIVIGSKGNLRYALNTTVLKKLLPDGDNQKVASISLGSLSRIYEHKDKDSVKPYVSSAKVDTIRPSDTVKFAELVSKYKLMTCILQPNYTFCMRDTTTRKFFNCTVVDCNVLHEDYTNCKEKDHLQWTVNVVSLKERNLKKMIVLSTRKLRDFVKKDTKNCIPSMKILDKTDWCLT